MGAPLLTLLLKGWQQRGANIIIDTPPTIGGSAARIHSLFTWPVLERVSGYNNFLNSSSFENIHTKVSDYDFLNIFDKVKLVNLIQTRYCVLTNFPFPFIIRSCLLYSELCTTATVYINLSTLFNLNSLTLSPKCDLVTTRDGPYMDIMSSFAL